MKGTVFQRPLELKVVIDGESWRQGDSIAGSLAVRNHGTEPVTLAGMGAWLARGSNRKVRAKSDSAFEPAGAKLFADTDLVAPGAETTLDWSFAIDRNGPITDSLASLFIVYGRLETATARGQLELPVHPHALIDEVIKAIQIQNRFVEKGRKMSKKGVEVRFEPPSSQAFASLEDALVTFRFNGESLEMTYTFNMKKPDMKADQRVVEQVLSPTQLRTASGRVNHESIEASVAQALGAARNALASN